MKNIGNYITIKLIIILCWKTYWLFNSYNNLKIFGQILKFLGKHFSGAQLQIFKVLSSKNWKCFLKNNTAVTKHWYSSVLRYCSVIFYFTVSFRKVFHSDTFCNACNISSPVFLLSSISITKKKFGISYR